MTVEVVTVWAPRKNHEKWRGEEYLQLMKLQRETALYHGHRHTIVTDDDSLDLPNALHVELPENLMRALLAGIVSRLRAPTAGPILFADMDVLIARPLDSVFLSRKFDLGLTNRIDPVAPINNGSMYLHPRGSGRALRFFERALESCEPHWGGDQEAISRMAAPVPEPNQDTIEMRGDLRIWFMRMKVYAAVPKVENAPHHSFTVHFKGETKVWAEQYARTRILR